MKRALALALALLAVAAPAAGAHATLESTVPARGSAEETAPGQVELRFSEPVELALGAVRVHDAEGREVQAGDAFHPEGSSSAVAVRLRDGLGDGGYTVTYKVVSADSHPISGGFVFAVGEDAAPPAAGVAELLGDQKAGPVTSVAFAIARGVQYGAIALGLGLLFVILLAWRPALLAAGAPAAAAAAFDARARTLLLIAAAAGVASAVVAIGLQAATAQGTTFWSGIGSADEVLDTRFGTVWAAGAAAWLVAGGLALARRPLLAAVPLGLLALLPGLGGHAGVQDPVAVLLPANVLHVLGASAWIGGIAALVVALPAATRALEPERRTPLLAATMGRFSTVALAGVAALLAGGILQSLLQLDAVDDLWDTAFGRAILVKIGIVLALLGLGALNRRRILPALDRAAAAGAAPGRAGTLLRRSLRAEVALGIAAFAATGALAGYAPGTAQPTGPYSASAALGPARAELTVEPARAGPNELHLYLFDAKDGTQYDVPRDLTITAALPESGIEPIALDVRKAGPGHYVVGGAPFSPAGDWQLEMAARISEFDELRTRFEVPVR
ncbi:MAG: copper resistance protein CopC [Solirubrobacteraceae bacterium]